MSHVIREQEPYLPMINGVAFVELESFSVSVHIDDEELVELFTSVPGYRLAEDEEVPVGLKVVKPPAKQSETPLKETAAQKKAREKAEQKAIDEAKAAADAQAQADADAQKVADEAAAAAAAEQKAAEEAEGSEGSDGAGDAPSDEEKSEGENFF